MNLTGIRCLGVLCDIAVAEGVIPAPYLAEHGMDNGSYGYRNRAENGDDRPVEYGILPGEVMRWAELPNSNPEVPVRRGHNNMMSDLAELNDNGYNFNQIADIIDQYL